MVRSNRRISECTIDTRSSINADHIDAIKILFLFINQLKLVQLTDKIIKTLVFLQLEINIGI